MAWVLGTERYATLVDIEGEDLTSACTCPYDDTCKHAVAVALEYVERLEENSKVPTIAEGDARLKLLGAMAGPGSEPGTDVEEGDGGGEPADRRRPGAVPGAVHSYLEQQTKGRLVALIEDLAGRHPAVAEALKDRADLSRGTVARMVAGVRKEIDALSASPAWRHHWDGEGYTPDYSRVRDRLRALLEAGHADEVLALGGEILEAGTEQVEESDDEGETAAEIAQCMDVVFQALPQTSLPPAEQLLWAVKADLNDEYDFCVGARAFFDRKHAASDWDAVAGKLTRLLEEQKPAKGDNSYSTDYRRDDLTDWLIMALEKAGRGEEIIPLCEREARRTQSYVRLVGRLIGAGRQGDAERWIQEGFGATKKQSPAIAGELRTMMRQMREREGDWPRVAAFRAGDFFAGPSLQTFRELQKAAERAGVWPGVRAAAMLYLETGGLPQDAGKAGDGAASPWPLPETGLPEDVRVERQDFPLTGTLIDVAIAEKRPDEVLRWYDRKKPQPASWGWLQTWSKDDQVAGAIAGAYPDRAVQIWKKLAESQIAETKPAAYEAAARFLHSIRRTLKKLDREKEWESYLAKLREANKRKRRLVEIIDGLSRKPAAGKDETTPVTKTDTKPLLGV